MNWSRKKLKQSAKKTIKSNYLQVVVACLIAAIVAGGYSAANLDLNLDSNEINRLQPATLSSSIMNIIESIDAPARLEKEAEITLDELSDKFNLRDATEGILATVMNNSKSSNSVTVGVLSTINQLLFNSRILEGSIMGVATLLALAAWVFIQNVLLVGQCRFHLENKNYSGSKVERLLFVFRIRRTLHVANIMLFRFIFNVLWAFTIVGGFIKFYSYRMIPYIIAENPNVTRKEAFSLSMQMMNGNKWAAFKLDISFLLWNILSLLTFGILRYLYVNPYMGTTNAELYFALRERAIEENLPLSSLLNDRYLLNPPEEGMRTYPTNLFSIPEVYKKNRFELDYDRSYSVSSLILIFFTLCFAGWIWEVALTLFKTGTFVNRGTMFGPWLPIYGTGGVLILILLKSLAKKPPILFAGIFFLCGALEYFASWMLEKLFDQSWWDYSNMFFNINGRICFEGLLFFAVAGFLIVYTAAPIIDEFALHMNSKGKKSICVVLLALFLVDFVYSSQNPNQGEGVTDNSLTKGSSTAQKVS